MGKVVKLQPQGKRPTKKSQGAGRPASAAASPTRTASRRPRRPRRRPDKTALVLGGGGFTGGVYEIGALRALDLLAVNGSVNEFDVYVGTSAGAFIAALCVNGITPEEMMRVVVRGGARPFRAAGLGDLLRPNLGELVRKGASLPLHLASLARQIVARRGEASIMDLALGLAEALPSGLYSGGGIESYLRTVLSGAGRTDDFRECEHELYITATDLDTCERVVFGSEDFKHVPISTAVRASGALPMVYAPVQLEGRELIDGGIVSTTNLDIAIDAGAKLVVVINPIVPYVNDFDRSIRTFGGVRARRVSDMGFPQIGYQAFKLLAHRRLHQMVDSWGDLYPGVDIVLIEPDLTDELMFRTSMMSFASRIEIAKHGFESVTYHLAGEFERYREISERHGLEISPERVQAVVDRFDSKSEEGGGWRRILEGTTSALLRQSGLAS